MTELVLGTVQFGLDYGINNSAGRPSLSEAHEIVKYALANGIREFDTAQAYGDSEEVLGNIFKCEHRAAIIHSKFVFKNKEDYKNIDHYLANSLKHLNINKLGYFYFHKFEDYLLFNEKKFLLSEYFSAHSLGLAVSVYDEREFRVVLDANFVKAIQLPFNIFDSSEDKIILMREAQKKGVKIYCRSVFLQGLFFMNLAKLPEKLRKFAPYLANLDQISKTYQVSKMSLALNFVKQFSEIDGVLIGVDNKAQLVANLEAWKENCPVDALEKMRELVFPDRDLLMPKNW